MVVVPKESSIENMYIISEEDGINKNMGMDISIINLKKNQEQTIEYIEKECAILLVQGEINMKWNNLEVSIKRENCFDYLPSLLHLPRKIKVHIKALEDSEILVQGATNSNDFSPKFYKVEDCKEGVIDYPALEGTAKRLIRDIINYDVAPYSKLVIGEVITLPGKWSSYPPHSHDQPEVYYYKFTKPQGFGTCFVGENAFKIKDKTASIIEGGLVHPQVAAPGYGMYYCWMIKHLDNNPWTTRENEKDHEWLFEKDAVVWHSKK